MSISDLTLKTVGDYAAFVDEMQATEENVAYMNRVYMFLNDAQPGERFEIHKLALQSNMRKFVGCVCLYFWDTNRVEFDNEYKTIKKL